MIKKIPQKTIVICDACLNEVGDTQRRTESKLTLKRHGLDYQGYAVGDATISLDLCDNCSDLISNAINKTAEEIRR